MNRWANLLNW